MAVQADLENRDTLEAENAVIGALLVAPELYGKASRTLCGGDFYGAFNRVLYEEIGKIYAATGTCDLLLLLEKITAREPAKNRNDIKAHLMRLSDSVAVLENTERYCGIVKKRSISRRARKMVHEAYERGFYTPEGEPQDAIRELTEKLAELARDKTKRASRSLHDILLEVNGELFGGGADAPLDTGFGTLDGLLDGIYPSDLIFVGAYTGVGKTAFALQILTNMAKKGKKTLLYSQEMKDTQNAIRMVARQSGVDLGKLKKAGRLDGHETEKVVEAISELSKLPMEIRDNGGITVEDIRLDCATKKDLDVIFIDHIGLMRAPKGDRKTKRYDEITQTAIDLRALAMQTNKPVVVLSQFNRDSVKTQNEPDLGSFRDSGEIEQSATAAILLWQTPDYAETGVVGVKVAKNRQGRPGKMYMRFDGARMNFTEVVDYRPNHRADKKTSQKEIDEIFGKKG